MIAGSTVAEIKMFIDTARGTSDSLADLEQFGQASDLLPADRVAYAFSNGQVLQDAIEQAFEQPEWYAQIEESLGSLITYSGVTISAAEAGLRFDSVSIPVNVGDEFSANGVAANLDGASRMPIDTVIFAEGFELGQSTLMNALGIGLVAAFITASSSSSDEEASPTPVSVDDLYDQMAQLIGFNLKTDFIDQLTGPYAFGVWNVDAEMPTVALVSGADDLVKLGDTLGTISLLIQAGGQGQTNVTSLVVEGGSLDHVEFEDGGTTYEIDYGVANGEFVLSLGGGAETVVNGPAESLADSTRYTTALSYLPSEYQAVYYVDLVRAEDAGEDAAGALIGEDGPLANMLAIPEAGGSPAESLAAVSYVEDGYAFTSGIVVVP